MAGKLKVRESVVLIGDFVATLNFVESPLVRYHIADFRALQAIAFK